MRAVTRAGGHGKANAGISNDKGGGIPPRRKAEVSRAMPISDGMTVNIPSLPYGAMR